MHLGTVAKKIKLPRWTPCYSFHVTVPDFKVKLLHCFKISALWWLLVLLGSWFHPESFVRRSCALGHAYRLFALQQGWKLCHILCYIIENFRKTQSRPCFENSKMLSHSKDDIISEVGLFNHSLFALILFHFIYFFHKMFNSLCSWSAP